MNNNGNNSEELNVKEDIDRSYDNNKAKKLKGKNTLIILLCIFALLLTNVVSYIFGASFSLGSNIFTDGFKNLSDNVLSYKKILVIRNLLEKTYHEGIDNSALLDEALKGMVNSIGDPYTVYMDKKEFEDFNLKSKGNYVGIGIQVAPKDGKIVVVSVFEDSPAYRAGILPGDFIINVSNEDVDMDSIDKAISLIKGEKDTEVSLVVERNGEQLKFNIYREEILIDPVEYEKIDDKIGYLKLNVFDEGSSERVKEALKELNSEKIILDLRGNPGGLLNECVEIASQFIPEGKTIVSTKGRDGKEEVFKASKGIAENTEIVVLGDSGSASASEVLIGALKDHNRATFIGEKTFGKGLVQSVFSLGDGSGVKITISKYYTPNGEYINGIGISPDVEVLYDKDEYIKNLQNTQDNEEELRKLDTQYQKALEILKN